MDLLRFGFLLQPNVFSVGRGYDVYDLYDLGEFDQKSSIATRYGTKEEYLNAIEVAHEANMGVYADIVLNHRMGGDEQENITVQQVDEEDRLKLWDSLLKL